MRFPTSLFLIAIVCSLCGGIGSQFYREYMKRHEVTFYNTGTITANGDLFDKHKFTLAVKDRDDLGRWFRFTFRGKVVYAYANDLLPQSAKAEYDLSQGAFEMIASPREGRIRALVWRMPCP